MYTSKFVHTYFSSSLAKCSVLVCTKIHKVRYTVHHCIHGISLQGYINFLFQLTSKVHEQLLAIHIFEGVSTCHLLHVARLQLVHLGGCPAQMNLERSFQLLLVNCPNSQLTNHFHGFHHHRSSRLRYYPRIQMY